MGIFFFSLIVLATVFVGTFWARTVAQRPCGDDQNYSLFKLIFFVCMISMTAGMAIGIMSVK